MIPEAGSEKENSEEQISEGVNKDIWQWRGGSSLAARASRRFLRCTVRPVISGGAYFPRIRYPWGWLDQLARWCIRPHSEYSRTRIALEHTQALWCIPKDTDVPRVILYLHGGGFVCCGVHTHQRLATYIAAYAQAGVLLVDYRQLPDHYADESIDDCVEGYRWLRAHGFSAEQIAIVGDSAGGYLTFATALKIREDTKSVPAALVGISPFTDWEIRTKTTHANTKKEVLLPNSALYFIERKMGEALARARNIREVVEIPNLFEYSYAQFPPVLVHVSRCEVLLPDAQRLVEALTKEGVAVTGVIWEGQPHVFQAMDVIIPEAHTSMKEIGEFIRGATEKKTSSHRGTLSGTETCEGDTDNGHEKEPRGEAAR